jgi:hypothetical protein
LSDPPHPASPTATITTATTTRSLPITGAL